MTAQAFAAYLQSHLAAAAKVAGSEVDLAAFARVAALDLTHPQDIVADVLAHADEVFPDPKGRPYLVAVLEFAALLIKIPPKAA